MSDDVEDFRRGPGLKPPTRSSSTPPRTPGPIPCPWSECRCTHTDGCVAGWLEDDNGHARPCPVCRTRQAAVLANPDLSHAAAMRRLQHPEEGQR